MELSKTVDALKAVIEEIAGLDDRDVFTILSGLAEEYDWVLSKRDPGPDEAGVAQWGTYIGRALGGCTICGVPGPQHLSAEDCFDHAEKRPHDVSVCPGCDSPDHALFGGLLSRMRFTRPDPQSPDLTHYARAAGILGTEDTLGRIQ